MTLIILKYLPQVKQGGAFSAIFFVILRAENMVRIRQNAKKRHYRQYCREKAMQAATFEKENKTNNKWTKIRQ